VEGIPQLILDGTEVLAVLSSSAQLQDDGVNIEKSNVNVGHGGSLSGNVNVVLRNDLGACVDSDLSSFLALKFKGAVPEWKEDVSIKKKFLGLGEHVIEYVLPREALGQKGVYLSVTFRGKLIGGCDLSLRAVEPLSWSQVEGVNLVRNGRSVESTSAGGWAALAEDLDGGIARRIEFTLESGLNGWFQLLLLENRLANSVNFRAGHDLSAIPNLMYYDGCNGKLNGQNGNIKTTHTTAKFCLEIQQDGFIALHLDGSIIGKSDKSLKGRKFFLYVDVYHPKTRITIIQD
jgi:hypothetical protein